MMAKKTVGSLRTRLNEVWAHFMKWADDEALEDIRDRFNEWLDDWAGEDRFGTEQQNDPRGDAREDYGPTI